MTIEAAVAIALITSITTIALAYLKMRSEIRQVHHLVNSRMTELLELTRESSVARGRLQGHDDPPVR